MEISVRLLFRLEVIAVTVLVGMFVFVGTAQADISPDPSFGIDGRALATLDFDASLDGPIDAAIQSDGKIVVAGGTYQSPTGVNRDMAVARFNPDGTLDSTFNGDGTLFIDVDQGGEYVSSVAVGPDGKIVIAGDTRPKSPCGTDCATKFVIVRLDSAGNLDTTFDGDGIVVIPYSQQQRGSVAIQPDNKIIVGGGQYFPGFAHIVRLDVDGSPDETFGIDGFIGLPEAAMSMDLALLPSGKVVAAARSDVALGPADTSVFRFNSDGSPDSTFDGDGRRFVELFPVEVTGDPEYPMAIESQPDGKLVISGGPQSGNGVSLVRLNSDGSNDGSFGTAGRTYVDMSVDNTDWDWASDLLFLDDGRIMVVGPTSFDDFDIAVRNADGSPDTSFDGDGLAQFDVSGGGSDVSKAVVKQNDGNPIVAGYADGGFGLLRLVVEAHPPPIDPPPTSPPQPIPTLPPPPLDTMAPVFNVAALKKKVFKPTRACKAKTSIYVDLSEPASLRADIQRKTRGKFKTVSTLRDPAVVKSHTLRVSGCNGKKPLPPGSYRISVVATDASGNVSSARYLTLTIKR